MRAPTRDIALLVGCYVWEMTDKFAVLGYTIVGFNFGQGGTLQASSGEDELDSQRLPLARMAAPVRHIVQRQADRSTSI